MILEWPQVTMAIFFAIEFGFQIARHGKPREGEHNFFTSMIATGLVVWLLYAGGFWTP